MEMPMETMTPSDTSEILNQVEGAGALLALIPRYLEANAGLRAKNAALTREVEALRSEVEPLRADLQRGRAEREELGEALGKVMGEMSRVFGEFAPRFRLPNWLSPFARETHGNGHGSDGGHRANGARPPAQLA